jgi:hypothetical protein
MAATVSAYAYSGASATNVHPKSVAGNTQSTNKFPMPPTAGATAGTRYHLAWTLMILSFKYRRLCKEVQYRLAWMLMKK